MSEKRFPRLFDLLGVAAISNSPRVEVVITKRQILKIVIAIFGAELFALSSACKRRAVMMEDFKRDLKEAIEPDALQRWAVSVLATNSIGEIDMTNVPGFVSVRGGPSSADVGLFGSGVSLNWGGGFGHWGIMVGDTNFVAAESSNLSLSIWRPGIYFYYETK